MAQIRSESGMVCASVLVARLHAPDQEDRLEQAGVALNGLMVDAKRTGCGVGVVEMRCRSALDNQQMDVSRELRCICRHLQCAVRDFSPRILGDWSARTGNFTSSPRRDLAHRLHEIDRGLPAYASSTASARAALPAPKTNAVPPRGSISNCPLARRCSPANRRLTGLRCRLRREWWTSTRACSARS
jgi:hypothetical protein